ncbi:hypothetical protein ACOSQ2_015145 [Xanthoceras sorbifolium]
MNRSGGEHEVRSKRRYSHRPAPTDPLTSLPPPAPPLSLSSLSPNTTTTTSLSISKIPRNSQPKRNSHAISLSSAFSLSLSLYIYKNIHFTSDSRTHSLSIKRVYFRNRAGASDADC